MNHVTIEPVYSSKVHDCFGFLFKTEYCEAQCRLFCCFLVCSSVGLVALQEALMSIADTPPSQPRTP